MIYKYTQRGKRVVRNITDQWSINISFIDSAVKSARNNGIFPLVSYVALCDLIGRYVYFKYQLETAQHEQL